MAERIQNAKGITILRLKQVSECTGLSRSTIYDRMNPKSPRYDPTFPKSVELGPGAVGWVESEIQAWLASRVNGSDGPSEKASSVANAPVGKIEAQSSSATHQMQSDELEEMRVATIRRLLEENARNGAIVRYSELMAAIMLSPNRQDDWRTIDDIIARISKSSYRENHVLLGVHVRQYKGSGVPRDAFFELAQSLGYQCDDREAFVNTQIRALFAHYSDPRYKTEKNLRWIETRNKCFLTFTG